MENPEVDISKVVDILVKAASPDVQQAAVRKCVLLKISAPYWSEESLSHNTCGPPGISLAMLAFDTRCIV
jgi:hypothetical protein